MKKGKLPVALKLQVATDRIHAKIRAWREYLGGAGRSAVQYRTVSMIWSLNCRG